MYELFMANNLIEPANKNSVPVPGIMRDSEVGVLMVECGGVSISEGLYRVHSWDSSSRWATIISEYFPDHRNRIIPFGFDWLGRQFAADPGRPGLILMFDPATAEELNLDQTVESFHNNDLVTDKDDFLSVELFKESLLFLKMEKLIYTECLGYKVPLFLGGEDHLENYESTDMEVYWTFQCQLYHQIKNLPPGTKINSIKFEK